MADINAILLSMMDMCNNHFIRGSESGKFEILESVIGLKGDYMPGQYALIMGSRLNDGLFAFIDTLYTLEGSKDEPEFDGTVYILSPPKIFMELAQEIQRFDEAEGKVSPYASESVLGFHSYTKAQGKDGKPLTWQTAYADSLQPWRMMWKDI